MIIYKFGGSSVGTPDRIAGIITLLRQQPVRAVVFSAFSGVTDQLIAMARRAAAGMPEYADDLAQLERRHLDAIRELVNVHQQSNTTAIVKTTLNELEDILQGVFLIRECSPKTLDLVQSFGERLSNFIISRALVSAELPCEYLDARRVVRTDPSFGGAQVRFPETDAAIRAHFQAHPLLQIVTGFVGATSDGETTTLGRGGSDYTASIFGAALGADEVHIWTDVDGVLTADPRKVPNAFSQPDMTYTEALEMSHFGAKVIYPPTIQPLMQAGIPIRIRNTFRPEASGTWITRQARPNPDPIRGITSISQVGLIRVEGAGMIGVAGVAQRIFGALARNGISVILISQASSEQSVCFAVAPEAASRAVDVLEAEFDYERSSGRVSRILADTEHAIVAIVGENMRQVPGIAGRVFQALGNSGVNVAAIAQGSSELNISIVISRSDEAKALRAIHDAFFAPHNRVVNVFLIGVGRVGAALADLIRQNRKHIADHKGVDIRLVAVANSRKMYVDLNGIDAADWREHLDRSGGTMDVDTYIGHLLSLNMPGSVLVDCTAGTDVNRQYARLLDRSVAVVTPNKTANAGSLDEWRRIRAISRKRQTPFRYETNVGAALPMVNTIRDLADAGDAPLLIEGVLSGTLSYLFNSFDGTKPFSALLRDAFEAGYTEPDPRDDLNGLDAARKILILAREAGWELELVDVRVSPALPDRFMEPGPVDAFWARITEADAEMEARRRAAADAGRKLAFLASVREGEAKVGLAEIGPEHPAYHLRGTDNLLSVNTRVYDERPLVVTGPGAGPLVTASGVLSDILRVAEARA
jgi:aspartokinase/homoserine dehydrogenase 1